MEAKFIQRAHDWYGKHQTHVKKLLIECGDIPEIEPSGSDVTNPALWKDIHWAWFLSTHG